MKELRVPLNLNLSTYAELMDTTLSNEGLDIVKHIPEFFTSRLALVVDFFGKEEKSLKEYEVTKFNIYAKDLNNNRATLARSFNSIDVSLIKRRKVPVTVGLDVDVLKLATIMAESNKVILDNLMNLLDETSTTIARLVSDKDYRLSSRPVTVDKKYIKAIKTLENNLAKVIDPKQTKDTLSVGKLMPSIPHLTSAIELALNYSGSNITDMYKQVLKEVATIHSYSNSLWEEFKGETSPTKKVRLVEVSKYLQTAANMVTQSVNTMYMSNQSVIIMNNLVKTITK